MRIGQWVHWVKIWGQPAGMWSIVIRDVDDTSSAGYPTEIIIGATHINQAWKPGFIVYAMSPDWSPSPSRKDRGCICEYPRDEDVPERVWAALAKMRLLGVTNK